MDPNALSNLDPKLKETYEKVMGTNTASPAQSAPPTPVDGAPTPIQENPNSDGLSAPIQPPLPDNPAQSSESPQTVTINQPLPNPAAASSDIITKPQGGHGGLIKVFYVLGATVFFVIYIFFWMKIFNISLPF